MIVTENTSNPETKVFPLIPDYFSFKNGVYTTLSKQSSRAFLNVGIRYDYEDQRVATFTNSFPREFIRYKNNFHNLGAMIGAKINLTSTQTLSFNSGLAMRNPGINELYSNGLHQGVSGIEEGDVNLMNEQSFKNSLEYKWLPNTRVSFSSLLYFQHISDFIFLNPQDEFRSTIRGTFPVFKYEQTDANIYGLDVATHFTLSNSIFGMLKYSFIRGVNISGDLPLVFIPPNSAFGSLTYRSNRSLKVNSKIKLEEFELELNNRYVFRQNHLQPEQDFVAPPDAYNLVGVKLSTNLISPKSKFRFFAKVDNLLNIKYRDYLNRQRYFADDVGISLSLGLNFKF